MPENKDFQLCIRFTPSMAEDIAEAARNKDVRIAEYIRAAVLDYMDRNTFPKDRAPASAGSPS
jgi:hypothetical protein